jgi:hypothetical protein
MIRFEENDILANLEKFLIFNFIMAPFGADGKGGVVSENLILSVLATFEFAFHIFPILDASKSAGNLFSCRNGLIRWYALDPVYMSATFL